VLVEPTSRVCTRLQNNICKPKQYTDGTIWYACLAAIGELEYLAEALQHDQWQESMDEEYKGLVRNGTWHLGPR
jgi:hypothetical protein